MIVKFWTIVAQSKSPLMIITFVNQPTGSHDGQRNAMGHLDTITSYSQTIISCLPALDEIVAPTEPITQHTCEQSSPTQIRHSVQLFFCAALQAQVRNDPKRWKRIQASFRVVWQKEGHSQCKKQQCVLQSQ
jgi:hypothetical protein